MSKGNGPEAPVLNGCLRYLDTMRIYYWRNSTGAADKGRSLYKVWGGN